MDRKILLFYVFVLFISNTSLFAESSGVKVKAQMNYKKGAMEITCLSEKNYPCTVELSFDELENFAPKYKRGDVIHVVVSKGQDAFLSLKAKSGVTPRISITSDFVKGNLMSKPDLGYTYLLPLSTGKSAKVSTPTFNGKTSDCDLDAKNWYCLSFRTESGDTIYASRRGIVTGVKNNMASVRTRLEYSFQENFVEICHNDGTFACYRIFRNNGIFVNEGDTVEAGQPIGIAGGENYAEGSHFCFSVYHPVMENLMENGQQKTKIYREYLKTKFYTRESSATELSESERYTTAKTIELITREMSKSEKKQFLENKNITHYFGLLTLQ